MMLDRRTFLAQAAAAPLLFGLEELLAQEPAKSPEWFAAALKTMKETGRCGVAIVAPEKDDEQIALGRALWGIIQSRNSEVHELLCEAVFVCLSPALATGRVRNAGETDNLFLLDPEGKRLAARSVAPGEMNEPAKFLELFGPLLHGPEDARLKERAEAIGRSLTPGQKRAVEELDSDEFRTREQATTQLAADAVKLVPWLIWLKRTDASLERRWRAGAIIEGLFSSSDLKAFGPRLPYGTVVPKFVRGGCGMWVEERPGATERLFACGMAMVSEEAAKFLRVLAK